MSNLIDNTIALRVLYLLVLPFNKWPAFDNGTIDKDGKELKDYEDLSLAEKDNWSMLHRLVCRLKVLLGKLPAGKTMIASMVAAYMLVKEGIDEDGDLQKQLDIAYDSITEDLMHEMIPLVEEIANSIGNVAGIRPGDEPVGGQGKLKDRKSVMLRRGMPAPLPLAQIKEKWNVLNCNS